MTFRLNICSVVCPGHITLQILISIKMCYVLLIRVNILFSALYGMYYASDFSYMPHLYGCTSKDRALHCNGQVPRVIPSGISKVLIRNNTVAMTNVTFSHLSWRKVQLLDIEEEDQITDKLVADMFRNLHSLITLGLHLPSAFHQFGELSNNAFAGLISLQHLDLSDCSRFSFDTLFDVLKNSSNFPKLRELILKNFNNIGYGTLLSLNSTFNEILGQRHVDTLVVDGSRVSLAYVDPNMSLCSSLKTFSARRMDLIQYKATKHPGTCRALTTIDLSGFNFNLPHCTLVRNSVTHKPSVVVNYTDSAHTRLLLDFIANVHNIYLEDLVIKIPILPIHYKIIYERNGTLVLKHISLKGTVLPTIDIEVQTKLYIVLQGLDLSNCQIGFIGPKTLARVPFSTVSNLSLANNNLHLMESTSGHEYSKLFSKLTNLRRLDLSSNRLATFPPNMLRESTKIESLDLSHNKLKQFYQSIVLSRLRYIDLGGNRIEYLDLNSRKWFDSINSNRGNKQFTLDLRNNSFQCTCATLEFFTWMFAQNFVLFSKPTTCSWNSIQIQVSKDKLNKLRFECNKASYILRNAIISVGGLIVFIAVTAFCFRNGTRIYKKYSARKRGKKAISEIQNESFKYSFLAFLSYSPFDEDVILKEIHPHLLDVLCQITMVTKEYICIGDREFRPGYSIYNETYRCLNDSAVALVIISQDYCQNPHCKNELEQIVFEEKPAVLLLLDPIDKLEDVPLVKQLICCSFSVNTDVKKGSILFKADLKSLAWALLENVK